MEFDKTLIEKFITPYDDEVDTNKYSNVYKTNIDQETDYVDQHYINETLTLLLAQSKNRTNFILSQAAYLFLGPDKPKKFFNGQLDFDEMKSMWSLLVDKTDPFSSVSSPKKRSPPPTRPKSPPPKRSLKKIAVQPQSAARPKLTLPTKRGTKKKVPAKKVASPKKKAPGKKVASPKKKLVLQEEDPIEYANKPESKWHMYRMSKLKGYQERVTKQFEQKKVATDLLKSNVCSLRERDLIDPKLLRFVPCVDEDSNLTEETLRQIIFAANQSTFVKKALLTTLWVNAKRNDPNKFKNDKVMKLEYQLGGASLFAARLRRYIPSEEYALEMLDETNESHPLHLGTMLLLATQPLKSRRMEDGRYQFLSTWRGIIYKDTPFYIPSRPYKNILKLYFFLESTKVIRQNDKELAILQTEYDHLLERISDVKNNIKTLEEEIEKNETQVYEMKKFDKKRMSGEEKKIFEHDLETNQQDIQNQHYETKILQTTLRENYLRAHSILQEMEEIHYNKEKDYESDDDETQDEKLFKRLDSAAFVAENYPLEFEEIKQSKEDLFRDSSTRKSMPFNIVCDFVKTYAVPDSFYYVKEVVEWVKYISRPNEEEGEDQTNVVIFPHIPVDFFKDVVFLTQDGTPESLTNLVQDYNTTRCAWLKSFGKKFASDPSCTLQHQNLEKELYSQGMVSQGKSDIVKYDEVFLKPKYSMKKSDDDDDMLVQIPRHILIMPSKIDKIIPSYNTKLVGTTILPARPVVEIKENSFQFYENYYEMLAKVINTLENSDRIEPIDPSKLQNFWETWADYYDPTIVVCLYTRYIDAVEYRDQNFHIMLDHKMYAMNTDWVEKYQAVSFHPPPPILFKSSDTSAKNQNENYKRHLGIYNFAIKDGNSYHVVIDNRDESKELVYTKGLEEESLRYESFAKGYPGGKPQLLKLPYFHIVLQQMMLRTKALRKKTLERVLKTNLLSNPQKVVHVANIFDLLYHSFVSETQPSFKIIKLESSELDSTLSYQYDEDVDDGAKYKHDNNWTSYLIEFKTLAHPDLVGMCPQHYFADSDNYTIYEAECDRLKEIFDANVVLQ